MNPSSESQKNEFIKMNSKESTYKPDFIKDCTYLFKCENKFKTRDLDVLES